MEVTRRVRWPENDLRTPTDGRGNVGAMSKPLGPYSPVVRAGDFVIVSGQGGMADGKVVDGGVTAETVQTMKNLAAQLESVGASLSDIVKTTCFLTDMENFAAFNAAYAEALGNHRPARSTVAVAGLPAGFLVEVEAWAYKPQ
jgi:2-iminobutanoate/2-iminopropanoate deaminase